MPVMEMFEQTIPEYYPGSRVPIVRTPQEEPQAPDHWDVRRNQREVTIAGVPHTFYTIGAVASALNRKPQTIRVWEDKRIIPNANITKRSKSDKPDNGSRRLYTRKQIVGLVQIAIEEGVLDPTPTGRFAPISSTNFASKAFALFKELHDNKDLS